MREILTIIAGCLVAALTAALAIPPFVDWDAQRAAIEARLSDSFGGAVRIQGNIALRLLPAPRMSVGAVVAERPGLAVGAQAMRLELSPTALVRGRWLFTEAALERATIKVAPDALAFDGQDAGRIGAERLTLSDARIEIAGAAPLVVDHVDLSAAADSLAGPFRGSGVAHGARKTAFVFSTGPVADRKARGKIALDTPSIHAEAEGDAALSGSALAFAGRAHASGSTGVDGPRWRASFALSANPSEARADGLELRVGDDENALAATGEAKLSREGAAAKLTARNLDLDRMHRAFPNWRPSQADLASETRATIALDADSATLGGETVGGPRLMLELAPGVEPRLKLDAEPPGRSQAHYEGAIALAPESRLDGQARVSTRDPHALGNWLAPAAPELAHVLASSPFAQMEVAASITTRGRSFEARVTDARLDRSKFSGDIRFQPPRDGLRARVDATLRSPALDIDGLPEFAAPAIGDLDFLLDLDAQAVRIARVGAAAAAADAGRIRMRLARYGVGLTLENLAVENLGGATLTGGGRLDRSGGRLDLRLDAERLGDLAKLAERVAPGGATSAFSSRAASLSPAHVVLSLAAQDGALSQMDVGGEAGGTKLETRLKPTAAGALGFLLKANAADSARLASQLGLAALPLKGTGPGLVEAEGEGPVGKPMTTKASAVLAGVRAGFEGEATLALDSAALAGRISFQSADATPLVQLLGLGAGDLTRRIPVEVAARIQASPGNFALEELFGSVSGARITGNLARNVEGAVTGALAFDALSAPFLASLVLGPSQPAAAGVAWSQIRFAPTLFDPPRVQLAISAKQVDLGIATANSAQANIALSPGSLIAKDIRLGLEEGEVSGDISLRREGAAALLRANASIANIRLEAAPFSTRATGAFALSGAGASAAELVGSLAGDGRLKLDSTRIARAAPTAVAETVAAFDRDEANVSREGVTQALARGLDRGDQTLAPSAIDLSLAAGRLTQPALAIDSDGASARVEAALDLRTMRLDIREKLQAQARKGWIGSPPAVDLVWSGQPSGLQRSIQADGLVASLTERAIARETARNAALEADIRERAFFNRRLKTERRLDAERRAAAEARRRAEEAARAEAARIEQERLAGERADRSRLDRDMRIIAPAESPAAAPAPKPAPRAPSAFAPATRGATPDPSTAGRY